MPLSGGNREMCYPPREGRRSNWPDICTWTPRRPANSCNDEEAEALFRRAVQIREQRLGQQHPQRALRTLYDLALFRKRQGHLREARSLAGCALQITSQFLGETHPKTIASRTLVAQLGEATGTSQDGVSAAEPRIYGRQQ